MQKRTSLLKFGHLAAKSGLNSVPDLSIKVFGLMYNTWLLDSLFNDACVLFVGFSPIEEALQTVATTMQFGASFAVPINDVMVGSDEQDWPDTQGTLVVGRPLTEPMQLEELPENQKPGSWD